MKNKFLITVLAVISVAILPSTLYANLESQFADPVISTADYVPLVAGQGGVTTIPASQFFEYNNFGQSTGVINRDEGYARYQFDDDFGTYTFGTLITDEIWISVNGFITFQAPNRQDAFDSDGLFIDNPTNFPENVAAPFWGNHVYRTSAETNYTPSSVLVAEDDEKITVEWKNININEPVSSTITNPSSIANFQVIIYKSTFQGTTQGNLEFAYGLVNGSSGQIVVTEGASIGIKGNTGEYMNGLCSVIPGNPNTPDCDPSTSLRKSSAWQPSGGTNKRILFSVFEFTPVYLWWGDGDTDLSKAPNQRHEARPQNRFVTFNDVRNIMRSVVTNVPLDSAYGREAYHADVDHDGRFYRVDTVVWAREGYITGGINDNNGRFITEDPTTGNIVVANYRWDDVDLQFRFYPLGEDPQVNEIPAVDVVIRVDSVMKDIIPIRSRDRNNLLNEHLMDLPTRVSNSSEVYFSADEQDAKWIVSYLMAKVTSLPWVYDTEKNGKLNYVEQIANNVRFGNPNVKSENLYEIPVYANGILEDGVSARISLDANIENITLFQNEDNLLMSDHEGGNLVIVGNGQLNSSEPIAMLYVSTDNDVINASGIRFNDEEKADITISLNTDYEGQLTITSNPLTNANTRFIFTPNFDGKYNVTVYDAFGNTVRNLNITDQVAGQQFEVTFDGRNNNGQEISNGAYIIEVSNSNEVLTNKLVVRK